MKLRIEHESAIRFCFKDDCETLVRPSGETVLKLDIQPQAFENWCWAAISADIGRYFNTGNWDQERVAKEILDLNGLESDDAGRILDREANLDKGLALVGCYSHWSPGRPSFDRISYEINMLRPVCVRIEWFHGGAHYIVIKGVTPETKTLHISDPKYGAAVMMYSAFPGRYQAFGGVWTETFWTKPPDTGVNPNYSKKEKNE